MGAKQVKQRLAVHEPVKLRHPVHRGCTPGDGVGLLIVHHLEPMLDRPVNAVGFGKVICNSGVEPPGRRQRLKRIQRGGRTHRRRSEEHTSELQSLMRISYAVFCLKKKKKYTTQYKHYLTNRYRTQTHYEHNSSKTSLYRTERHQNNH